MQNQKSRNWKTYDNAEIGVSFKYPVDFGSPSVTELDPKKSLDVAGLKVFSGKKISIDFFPIKKYGINLFNFSAFTSDYVRHGELRFNGKSAIERLCIKPGTYDSKGNSCRIIKTNGRTQIVENVLQEYGGISNFITRIYMNGSKGSQYTGIQISFLLDDINKDIEKFYNNCMDPRVNPKTATAYAISLNASKNIMNIDSLSEIDERGLKVVYEILSSLKFYEK